MVSVHSKAAELGNPSFVWRFGQDRRLALIRRYAALEDRRILDIGCGIGTYVKKFREFSPHVTGIDIDFERVREGARSAPNLLMAVSEHLPYRDAVFDVLLLNEVIEHVRDDRETLREAVRVTRPGGHIFIYAPNRLYPFETHGIFLGKRYVFGNIPLANYLPGPLRRRLIPHARAYLKRDIRRLVRGLDVTVVEHTFVYPGFDNIIRRSRLLGTVLRRVLYRAEQTPLRNFGLSHFVVLRRNGAPEVR
ncbi:MAG TPA: methyltransferase domain-containing protein [Dehalococcoidia bacterium]